MRGKGDPRKLGVPSGSLHAETGVVLHVVIIIQAKKRPSATLFDVQRGLRTCYTLKLSQNRRISTKRYVSLQISDPFGTLVELSSFLRC